MWGICFFTRLSGRWLNSVLWAFFLLLFTIYSPFAACSLLWRSRNRLKNETMHPVRAKEADYYVWTWPFSLIFLTFFLCLSETQIVRLSSCSVLFFLPGFWIRLWVRNVLEAKFKIKCVRRGHSQNNRHWQPAGTKKQHNLSASLMTFWWIGNLLTVFSTLQRDEGFAVFLAFSLSLSSRFQATAFNVPRDNCDVQWTKHQETFCNQSGCIASKNISRWEQKCPWNRVLFRLPGYFYEAVNDLKIGFLG